MRRLILTALLIFIGDIPASNAAEHQNIRNNCGLDTGMSFEGWEKWRQITRKPVRSAGHSNNWVGIFVNQLAKETYLAAGSPYPMCSTIVKPVYRDDTGAAIKRLTVMVKMPAGYDPENGNWWYGLYDADGGVIQQGRLFKDCIECHKGATDTDYLFSADVLEELQE